VAKSAYYPSNSMLTLAQLAIAWAIARLGVTHALVGARDAAQAAENAAAATGLPAQDVAKVTERCRLPR